MVVNAHTRGQKEDAINLFFYQYIGIKCLLIQVGVGVAANKAVAVLEGGILNTAGDFGEEGVSAVGDDRADRVSLSAAEAARQAVGLVAKLLHNSQDPLSQFIADRTGLVDNVGD